MNLTKEQTGFLVGLAGVCIISAVVAFWLWFIPVAINNMESALRGNLPRSGWVPTSQGEIEIIANHLGWKMVEQKNKPGRPVFRDAEN